MLLKFLVFLAMSSASIAAPSYAKRNVIFMVSDGTGLATHTLARQYLNITQGIKQTPIDTILVGTSASSSYSHVITDSAAGATAFSCGKTTINYYVGVTPDGKPCGTLLEAAKAIGMKTGLVVTSSITDATPAAFASHAQTRKEEDSIASQLLGEGALGRTVDLMFGGGKKFFLPKSKGGVREDGRDLITDSKKTGWRYVENKQSFDKLNAHSALPLYGLFADENLPYNVDIDPSKEPSLSEMAKKSLEILKQATQDSAKGFFVMIEGSLIDKAAHLNDPVGHLGEAVEYYKTIQIVKDFVAKNPDTVMISVSDHETGGLVIGKDVMVNGKRTNPDWRPEAIQRAKMSALRAAEKTIAFKGDAAARKAYVQNEILAKGFGIQNASAQDIQATLVDTTDARALAEVFGDIVSKEAYLGWTTHGHSAIDVPLYAFGRESAQLRGSHKHTDLNKFVVDFLGLNLNAVTSRLNTPKKPAQK
jgi:alkaline phosphatase